MSPHDVIVTRQDKVAVVEINNGDLNLLTNALRKDLIEKFAALSTDTAVGAIVLTGKGTRAFSAGSDISEFPSGLDAVQARAELETRCCRAVEESTVPVVAALHGYVLGGGLELALACDIRIADSSAVLGFPEVKLGLFPSAGGTQRLPEVVGASLAKELICTGALVKAGEARDLGLTRLVDTVGGDVSAAVDTASAIAQNSRQAVRAIKRAISTRVRLGVEAGAVLEGELLAQLMTSRDTHSRINAFLHKRHTPTTDKDETK